MAINVNTNVSSLRGQASLNKVNTSLNTTYTRLSTGLRINSAKDDAAGLQISDRITSQINGLNQGNRNANDGIALAQTAEGAMDEISSMLQRIRTLAVQSANGTNTSTDRAAIQAEVTQLSAEITRIACQTTYGGMNILDGKNGTKSRGSLLDGDGRMTLQVGANDNDTIKFSLSSGFTVAQLATQLGQSSNVTSIAADVTDVDKQDTVGAYSSFKVSTAANAQTTLGMIDDFIGYVDKKRGDLGAVQNRLESTINNQSNIATNESDARSRIRDTDFAEEASNLSSQNIIQQAASSMLTQANSRPQIALSLLG